MSKTSLYSRGAFSRASGLNGAITVLQNRNASVKMVAAERNPLIGEGFGADFATTIRKYAGGVYSPSQNRIYFVPYSLDPTAEPANFHYINCQTNQIVGYLPTNGISVQNACWGGVFSPIQNRIYFAPYAESNGPTWHYVDCANDAVVTFVHGQTLVTNAYRGASYDPINDRVYYIPYGISQQVNWHYINCVSGSAVAYAHGATVAANGYSGGINYNGNIYFIPSGQANQPSWHYLNCTTSVVTDYNVSYITGVGATTYSGAILDPVAGRIYLTPDAAGVLQANLHYLDVTVTPPVLHAYANPLLGVCSGTSGGVYSPITNKLMFVPGGIARVQDQNLFALDLSTLVAVPILNPQFGVYGATTDDYNGGVYSPVNNTIYFVPNSIDYSSPNPLMRVNVGSKDVLPRKIFIDNQFNS